jgi:hypothetical protein
MAEANDSVQRTKICARLHLRHYHPRATSGNQSGQASVSSSRTASSPHVASEIVLAAHAYRANHRAELIAEATQTVLRWQAEETFGRRRSS